MILVDKGIRFIFILVFVRWISGFIDADIEEVERQYNEDVLSGKAPAIDSTNIELPNRAGILVKYQLDMYISKEVYDELLPLEGGGNSRVKRNAVLNTKIWPKTIPYSIDISFNRTSALTIMEAIQYVMRYTCVVFKPHTDERDFVYFKKVKNGCNTAVGHFMYEHTVNLKEPDCIKLATVVHEIGHVLGLYHEHMRDDRDTHVTVLTENITDGNEKEFKKLKVNTYDDYGKKYDYYSLMHYSKNAFGKRINETYKLTTLEPTDIEYLDIIGDCTGFSFLDVNILCSMYNCSEGCQEKVCAPGGFLGKNCKCYCPGPRHDPVQLCEKKAMCILPDTIDALNHMLEDTNSFASLNVSKSREVESGKTIKVEFNVAKKSQCGNHASYIKCNNGLWEGNTDLQCISDKCQLEQSWDGIYNVSLEFGDEGEKITEVSHADFVDLYCIKTDLYFELICERGEFVGELFPCEGKSCMIDIRMKRQFTFMDNGVELEDNTVEHGIEIQIVCKLNEILEANMTCVDGQWKGTYPDECPAEYSTCPVVPDARVSSHIVDAHEYNIQCLDGFEMRVSFNGTRSTANAFKCAGNQWKPFFPMCIPAPCQIPFFGPGKAKGQDGKALVSSFVGNGQKIRVTCANGHIPDTYERECKLGKWNQSFPICNKVVCGNPDIKNTTFSPDFEEFIYNDRITVDPCVKNLEFVGSKELVCQSNGQWSGNARCQKFCVDGKIRWKPFHTHIIDKDLIKGGKSFKKKHVSAKNCKKLCQKHTGFLCKSFSVGFEKSRSRLTKTTCILHSIDIDEHEEVKKRKTRWSTFARRCS